jgi:hypothetical protein
MRDVKKLPSFDKAGRNIMVVNGAINEHFPTIDTPP